MPHIEFVFCLAGIAVPKIHTACELAYGKGLALNINASANPSIEWYGTDFNAGHYRSAMALSQASGNSIRLFDRPFSEFCSMTDLPEFDLVVNSGTWSWISDDDRRVLLDFLKRKLAPGGILLVHYQTVPGSLGRAWFRNLVLIAKAGRGLTGRATAEQVPSLLDQIHELIRLNPDYMRAWPGAEDMLAGLRDQDPDQVAHEYFNEHWAPFRFQEMSDLMAGAGLRFATSAILQDHVNRLQLTARQSDFLDATRDVAYREAARDFFIDRAGRIDIWIKPQDRRVTGPTGSSFSDLKFMRCRAVRDEDFLLESARGETMLSRAEFEPLVASLPAGKIVKAGDLPDSGDAECPLAEKLAILCSQGLVAYVPSKPPGEKSVASCNALNAALITRLSETDRIPALASYILAAGFDLNDADRRFLPHWYAGHREPSALAGLARDEPVTGSRASGSIAEDFIKNRVPELEAAGIV